MQTGNQNLDSETEELDSLRCATGGLHNPMYSDFDNVCECAHEQVHEEVHMVRPEYTNQLRNHRSDVGEDQERK